MSASLVVLVPIVLLGLVSGLCFVGCILQSGGLDVFGPYRDAVTGTSGVVAFWPLDDAKGQTTAADIVQKPVPFNGKYGPNVQLQQGSIVKGDKPPLASAFSALFNGDLVRVDHHNELNPSSSFTVEAWVSPQWTQQDVMNSPTNRAVVASADGNAVTGWVLFATANNFWAADLGDGTKFNQTVLLPGSPQVSLGQTSYLAMTFDSSTNVVTLWVNPVADTPTPYARVTLATGFAPMVDLQMFIGAARPDLPAPTYFFNGLIQDVAFYNEALDINTIQSHFSIGLTG